jgi:hypothetical protein
MALAGPSYDMQATDEGTLIEITVVDGDGVAVDISAANTKEFIFKRVGTTSPFTKTAVFDGTGGTNGILQYTTTATDFLLPGDYEVQAHVVDTGVYDRYTSQGILQIGKNV